MGRKSKKRQQEQQAAVKPFCYYCDRDFADENQLIQHQKARHFKCQRCNKRFINAPAMGIHMQQMHGMELDKVPNALPGREAPHVVIAGMHGIPTTIESVAKRLKVGEVATASAAAAVAAVAPVIPRPVPMPMPMGMPRGPPPPGMMMQPPPMMGMNPMMMMPPPRGMMPPPRGMMPPPHGMMMPPPGPAGMMMPPPPFMVPPPGAAVALAPTSTAAPTAASAPMPGQQAPPSAPLLPQQEAAKPSESEQPELDVEGLVFRYESISMEEKRAISRGLLPMPNSIHSLQ